MAFMVLDQNRYAGLYRHLNPILSDHNQIIEHYKRSPFVYKDVYGQHESVNAIEFSGNDHMMFSSGNDGRVIAYNMGDMLEEPYFPYNLSVMHDSGVNSLASNFTGAICLSGGKDEKLFFYDLIANSVCQVVNIGAEINEIAVEPKGLDVRLSWLATYGRRIVQFDSRSGVVNELNVPSRGTHYSIQIHPYQSNILMSTSVSHGAALYDMRNLSRCLVRYKSGFSNPITQYAAFNHAGHRVVITQQHMPLTMYDTLSGNMLMMFDAPGFLNANSVKRCKFIGQVDEYVACGSDDFAVYVWSVQPPLDDLQKQYMWKEYPVIKTDQVSCAKHLYTFDYKQKERHLCVVERDPFRILRGHQGIVNQIKYNELYAVVATGGTEKMIKMWSPIFWRNQLNDMPSTEDQDYYNGFVSDYHYPNLDQMQEEQSLIDFIVNFDPNNNQQFSSQLMADKYALFHYRSMLASKINPQGLDTFIDTNLFDIQLAERFASSHIRYNAVYENIRTVALSFIRYKNILERCDEEYPNIPMALYTTDDVDVEYTASFMEHFFYEFEFEFDRLTVWGEGQLEEQELMATKQRKRVQFMYGLRKLRLLRLELICMLRHVRMRMMNMITSAKRYMTIQNVVDFEDGQLDSLKNTGWDAEMRRMHLCIWYSYRTTCAWLCLSTQLKKFREHSRFVRTRVLPGNLTSDNFELFTCCVGYHLLQLFRNGYYTPCNNRPTVDYRKLRLYHFANVSNYIYYLVRQTMNRELDAITNRFVDKNKPITNVNVKSRVWAEDTLGNGLDPIEDLFLNHGSDLSDNSGNNSGSETDFNMNELSHNTNTASIHNNIMITLDLVHSNTEENVVVQAKNQSTPEVFRYELDNRYRALDSLDNFLPNQPESTMYSPLAMSRYSINAHETLFKYDNSDLLLPRTHNEEWIAIELAPIDDNDILPDDLTSCHLFVVFDKNGEYANSFGSQALQIDQKTKSVEENNYDDFQNYFDEFGTGLNDDSVLTKHHKNVDFDQIADSEQEKIELKRISQLGHARLLDGIKYDDRDYVDGFYMNLQMSDDELVAPVVKKKKIKSRWLRRSKISKLSDERYNMMLEPNVEYVIIGDVDTNQPSTSGTGVQIVPKSRPKTKLKGKYRRQYPNRKKYKIKPTLTKKSSKKPGYGG